MQDFFRYFFDKGTEPEFALFTPAHFMPILLLIAALVFIYRNQDKIRSSYKEILIDSGLLDFVKDGMTIAIKANLVAPSKPEHAVVTHYQLLVELCKILLEKNAKVIVGDSPGGLYNEVVLNSIYKASKVNEIEQVGAHLNKDFSTEVIDINDLKILLDYYNYLISYGIIRSIKKY